MTTIVAVSDVHLGSDHSNEHLFREFLQEVLHDERVDSFVMVGDILDMWRADADVLMKKYEDVLETLTKMSEKKEVFYVVGNHDYHFIEMNTKNEYPFPVSKAVALPLGEETYWFIHGYQFEFPDALELFEEFADILCMGMDVMGGKAEYFWELYERGASVIRMTREWFTRTFDRSINPPEKRLSRKDIDDIREGIRRWRTENGAHPFLVYGHTHQPFVNVKGHEVNTGSWVADPYFPHLMRNTSLFIEEKSLPVLKRVG